MFMEWTLSSLAWYRDQYVLCCYSSPLQKSTKCSEQKKKKKIKSQGQDVTSSVCFMKQTISNSCGTIGFIHAIANNKDKMHFESGSTLKKFLEDSVSMSPEERAKYLENYDAIRVTHETSAHEGQTEFLKQLGLHPKWQFVDVYGMDPELLSMVPRPVCAVLLLFPITEKYKVFRTEEEEKNQVSGPGCHIISVLHEADD